MSKKGKRKQPLPPPPPPPPPPFHTTADGRAAIAAYDERDYVGTLRCIKNSRSRYKKCPFYHHATAFILYKIVLGNKYDDETNKKFIQDAAISALEASVQCSNSTTIAYFCACTLYDLARFNGEYDQVIQECNRALRIENPREPERSSFVFKDPSQEWEIEKTKQELRELIKKSERKKRWAAISSVEMIEESAKAAEKKVVEIKNQLARLGNLPEKEEMEQNPMREKLEERKKKQFADKFMANFEKANNARSFWNNEMSAEEKRSLFRVKREELEKHLTDRKEKDLLSEAIKFAKAQGEWKFWECCDCSEKFGDWQACMEHLCDSHDLRIHHDLASILPKRVDEISHEMIVNGEWKPVDTAEAIKILENESKSESCNPDDSGRCAEKGQDEHKGFSDEDVPLTKQMGSESDEEASSIAPKDWPLSDDNKRIALLESLRSTFQFLLRYNFLVQADIDDVIQNAVAMLETRFSDSLLKNLGPKTLKLVCFLESSELNSIIHKLQHVSGTLSEDTDEQLTGAKTSDFKEAVVFDNNSSNLILDGILSCGTDVMSWLYVGQEVGEPLKLWASLRESNKGQRVKMFESFKVERSKFVRAYEERSKLSEKMDALLAVNGICAEETERREENPEYVRKTFESLLRERQTELEEIIDVINQFDDDDAAYQFELDFILNVLETEQPVTAYQFENTSRVHENLNQSDDYVEEKIISWRDQLGNDMTLKTVTIIRSIVSMRLFNLHLGQISAYDYRLILLPMLKSFIKSRLECHIDEEDAKMLNEKLNEIQKSSEEPDNKGQTQGKSKNKKNKNKNKKRKGQGQAKDFKATGDIEQPSETGDTEQPLETGDTGQPSETGDTEQASLTQEKAVQNDNLSSEMDERADDQQQSVVTEKAEKKYNETEKLLEEPDNKGQTQRKSKNKKKNKNKKRKDQGEAMDFRATGDIGQRSAAGDIEQPTATGDIEQPLETGDIQRPTETGDIEQPSATEDIEQPTATGDIQQPTETGDIEQPSATEDIEQPTVTGDIQQPTETGDIKQPTETVYIQRPSLPQEKAVQNDNPNSEKDERSDDLQQSIAANEKLLEENMKYQLQFEHEARLNVNILGTGLGKEAANSFLYMIIQSLWNLREFQGECKKKLDADHRHVGTPCIVCAFFGIFAAKNRREAVDPTELRIALSYCHWNQNNLQLGRVKDASFFLIVILKALHVAFYAVNSDDEPEDMYEGSLDCINSSCLVHRIFGMDLFESIECINCHIRSGYRKNTHLVLSLNADKLRVLANKHRDMSNEELLELVGIIGRMTCGCGQLNLINRAPWCPPHVLTAIIYWPRGDQSSEDISTTLSALSNEVDVSKLFQGYVPDYTYFIVSMVCCSSDRQHSVCFLYDDQHDKHYVQHSESNVEVTGSWDDVISTCSRKRLLPVLLFLVNNDNPNSEKDERADDLQQSIAADKKLLEENVNYQLQLEHEARFNVNLLGTGLGKEAANSILYTIIQSLWNLREFQEECKKLLDKVEEHDEDPCIVCAFFGIIAAKNRGEAVDPTELRIALSTCYGTRKNFQEGPVKHASLFLLVIFQALHQSFNDVNSDDKPEDVYMGRLACTSSHCLVHRIFGMDVLESIECTNCHIRSGYEKSTLLYLTISAYDLRRWKNDHRDMSGKQLLELTGMGGKMTCGCGQLNRISCAPRRLPQVFISLIDWQGVDESLENISTTLSALSNELDLSKIFQGYLPDYTYFVASMVCLSYDRRYSVCFLSDDQHDEHYNVQHSDSNVEVTGSWADVISTCSRKRFLPILMFFVNKGSKYIGN